MTLSTCSENLVPLGIQMTRKTCIVIFTHTSTQVHVPGLLPTVCVVLLLWYRTVGTYLLACCLYFSTNSCAITYHRQTDPPLHYKRKRKRASTRYTAHFIRSLTRNNILHQNTNHYFLKNTLII